MERLRCDQGTIPVAKPAAGHERDEVMEEYFIQEQGLEVGDTRKTELRKAIIGPFSPNRPPI